MQHPQDDGYLKPWERAFNRVLTPFDEFIHAKSSSGVLLMVCTVVALLIANSDWAEGYAHLLHTHLTLSLGSWTLDHTLHHWINDGLMALFFVLVGLEIKREVLVGELSDPRQAVLPIFAAVGGMVVPALFYVAVNVGGPGIDGWGVPMATDIAFAVGVLVLVGSRVPKALFTFLVALAIVDDLGAVLVIAVFYTEQIHWGALGVAALLVGVLVSLNLGGIRRSIPYILVGLLLWLALMKSGVHATLAGVLTALTIPARSKYEPGRFSFLVRDVMDRFDATRRTGDENPMRNQELRAILQTLENGVYKVQTPLQRMEHSLHIPVSFLIIPLFALANAGIPIVLDDLAAMLAEPVTLGVMLGLVLGKPLGIAGCVWLALRQGWGQLPPACTLQHIIGAGLLGGIGFTMSIFISELGFKGQEETLIMAKTGVLFASLVAGVGGCLWLLLVARPAPTTQRATQGA